MAFDIREEDEDRQYNDEFEEYEDVKQPERPKFYRRKKFWMFCIPNAIIAIIIAVVLALYVIMPKIAQGLMNKSEINLEMIDITNPAPTGMDIVMKGKMTKTGPFHADISFPGLVTVLWNDKELGTTEIPGTSSASGGSGDLNLESKFVITNEAAFTEFSSFMLNAQQFEWQLVGKLNVKALGHTVKDLDLNKKITVNAFNGLSGIKIKSFTLPGDDPTGKGILVEIETIVTNPSAIQMYMGSLTLAISYKDVVMGYVSSSGLTMIRGEQTLAMKGVLIPQTTPEGLATTSEMMSRYCSNLATDTIATGFDVKPDGATSLGWLAAAVKNLKLTVPLQSPTPLQLIKALNLGALGLAFTPPTAYQPVTTSTGVIANYGLPDGFNFKINFNQVANAFTLSRNGIPIANLNSSYNPSTSDMAAGTLTFNLLQTPLIVPETSHQPFQEFNRDLTTGSNLPFQVTGFASVYANTSIGTVNLVNIPFNATTELSGLQSLANPAPTITALQVVAGTPTALTMAITVVNPSSISLSAGDVVLDLIYKGVRLGTVTMPNLAIVPGANTVQASSTIDPRASPEGLELLNLYTSGAGASVSIVGTPTSTAVESLSLAFGALNIGSQMPGLTTKLLAGASLIVLDTTLVNGLAQTVVTVNNPFEPPMSIVSIDTKITYNGVALGAVVTTFPTPPVIPGVGQGTITAGLAMNTNPHDLITLIRAQAVKNGLDTTAFDGLLSLQAGGNPPSSIFDGFNVAEFTVKAMAGLVVDISMTTTVRVGDYEVTMPYTQTGVPTATDQTILKLIPIVGTPIAQLLVERSTLAFDAIKILSPGETSFNTDINGLKINQYVITDIDAAGMHMLITAELFNPSTIGMTIPQSIFSTEVPGKVLGPAIANNLALEPHSPSFFNLTATIATGNGDMVPYLTAIFQHALDGVETPLTAQGVGAPGVSWLDNAIKKLRLATSLPPLPVAPIDSVVIDAMSMDFTCGDCDYAPMAGSSITAKTNLPFLKGAPIVALKQDVDVLDSAGNRIGRLTTAFEVANSTGAYVSTITKPAPLTIYPEARDKTYPQFINDLNVAMTTYELGLKGTADSKLFLGDLGTITVTGIKLDVKTKLDGLQGLADVKYLNLVTVLPDSSSFGAVVMVSINNPSKLTLKIGDLALSAGLNFTKEGYGADSYLKELTLVPGKNDVIATTIVNPNTPVGKDLANMLQGSNPPPLHLMALPGASKNPALDAGLKNLRQVLVLPPMLFGNYSAKAYDMDWYTDIPASAAVDGIFYVSTTVRNPFYGLDFNVVSVDGQAYDHISDATTLRLVDARGSPKQYGFNLIPPNPYSLKGNESKVVKFAVQFNPIIGLMDTADLQFWMDKATNSTTIDFLAYMVFASRVGPSPTVSVQYLASDFIYLDPSSGMAPFMRLHAGTSFSYLMKYWDDFQRNSTTVVPPTSASTIATPSASPITTTTVSVPPVTPTAGTTSPIVPSSPIPTSSPSQSQSPISPSPVSPSPVSPSP
ncbi:hypothetical protein BG000_000865 [Podila horticola]|nr:hypothetical protein BG000_000865 [Podila horticola]